MTLATAGLLADLDADVRRDAEWLLLERYSITRAQLPTATLSPAQTAAFTAELQRLQSGEPLAYILGNQDFWSLRLQVTPDTLIPRADTETLVEAVLQQYDQPPRAVIDLGTGSGAIALALKTERPQWRITATDASFAALAVAQKNAANLGLDIATSCGSWFDAITPQRFDIIASNPPYIDENDDHLADLTHEPISALVAPQHGLADIEHIVATAPSWLKPNGRVYLEHGYDQAAAVAALFVEHGYAQHGCIRDLPGNERVTWGQFDESGDD